MLVCEHMTKPVYTVQAELPYHRALLIMQACELDHVPVVDEAGTLVGLVSEDELVVAAARHLDTCVEIGDVMRRAPLSVAPEARLDAAAAILASRTQSALPVVEMGRVVGVLTRSNVLDAYAARARRDGDIASNEGVEVGRVASRPAEAGMRARL